MDLTDSGRVPEGWTMRSIADVCERVTSGGTPSRTVPGYYEGGRWPWVKTQELGDRWIDDTEEHVTDEAVSESSAKVLPASTLLMAMYGATVGKMGLLRAPMTCNQACCAMIVDPDKADHRFLYYSLLASRDMIKGLAVGAAQQNLSGESIKRMRLPFPPLPEQRRIAHILGTLDDKIELNRRMNKSLEEMARALFKSWFVDFDPVRAKVEGRSPGLPQHLADLFPSHLVDSDLGPIPEGWEVKTIGDFAQLTIGGDWGADEKTSGAVAVRCLRGVDLDLIRRRGLADAPVRWISSDSLDRRSLGDGDVLVEGSGQCGRSLAAIRCSSLYGEPVIYSNFCKRLRCGTVGEAIYLEYLLNRLVASGGMSDFITGTAMPNLDHKGLMASHRVVVPPSSPMEEFERFVMPVRERLYSKAPWALEQIRDSLLLRLFAPGAQYMVPERAVEGGAP